MGRPTRFTSVAMTVLAVAGGAAGPAVAAETDVSKGDTTFAQTMNMVNLTEIVAGEYAQSSATTECIKQVGAVFVHDHRQLEAEVGPVAYAARIRLAKADKVEATAQKAMASLAKAHTAAYDKAWLNMMFAGHKQALSLIDKEIKQGINTQVKQYAQIARPVIYKHLRMVYGGKCHSQVGTDTIPAGESGKAAEAASGGSGPATGMALSAGGAVLASAGTAAGIVLLRRRRAYSR